MLGDGACLTFVRGVSPAQLLEAYDMDPAAAVVHDWSEAIDRFREWRADGVTTQPVPWVRVGRSGEWTFGIEPDTIDARRRELPEPLAALAIVTWTAKPTYDILYRDGANWVGFEPRMAWERTGIDSDRFLPQMRELGIRTERPTEADREQMLEERRLRRTGQGPPRGDSVLQMLAFLTLVADIRLPEEVAAGPLLTCRRGTERP